MKNTTRVGSFSMAAALALAAMSSAATASAQGLQPNAEPAAATTPAQGLRPKAEADAPDHSYLIPAGEIIGFDLLWSRLNRQFSGSSDYDVSWSSIRHNLHGPWVVDNDPFQVNQFAHPYQGSLYHNAARSAGLNYWEAAAYTFGGSVWWEITGEKTPPSRNDQIASGIAGSFLGEPLFRMAYLLRNSKSDLPHFWRELGAAAISPAAGLNRLAYGSRFDSAFVDNEPIYYGRLRVGASHAVRDDIGTATDFKRNAAEVNFILDYGVPGKPGYTYRRPFDYFSFEGTLNSANGVQDITTRGLLFGTDYGFGKNYRGIVGLYANYDYLAPQIFHMSTTGVSLGTTAQWWLGEELSLEGTGLAGIGYSAASTQHGVVNDRDYHYGVAPRVGLALRLTGANRASVDVSAQRYYLGHVADSDAGRDDISHAEAALTWRVHGRHAIGVRYVWSHRSASYPMIGERTQTLATVGLYYTLLGEGGFGTYDWRGAAGQ